MLGLAISALVVVYSQAFMVLMDYEGQSENADPFTALYWVSTTITTLGYGDIVFRSHAGRLFSIIVVFTGLIVLWALVLPFGVLPRLERLSKIMLSSAPPKIAGHIIICGYNPLVEKLTERLSIQKTPFLIIERSEEVARKIYRKYPTILGDPSDREVLENANLQSARLFMANESEELNAEVVMTVREISQVEIIAIVDDMARCKFLKFAGASRVVSPKTLLGNFIAQIAVPSQKGILPGAITLFGDMKLVQLPIFPWSGIIGKSLNFSSIKDTGTSIVGVWQKGLFKPSPGDDEIIQSKSVLMAVGDNEQLSMIREMTIGSRREGLIIIIGYGDVGRRAAAAICKRGIKPEVIDLRDLGDTPFKQVVGDGTSEETLVKAGVKDAIGTLIMLNSDSDIIYSTLLVRNLNPNGFIIARANHVRSAEKIYRAGADYVASVPIIASHMLAKMAEGDEEELALLYEDLELKIFEIQRGSGLAGKTIRRIDLPGRFGCVIVALKREGQAISRLDENMALKQGDVLALIGSPDGIEAFAHAYKPEKFQLIL
jgi:voltage-gated potassium channel